MMLLKIHPPPRCKRSWKSRQISSICWTLDYTWEWSFVRHTHILTCSCTDTLIEYILLAIIVSLPKSWCEHDIIVTWIKRVANVQVPKFLFHVNCNELVSFAFSHKDRSVMASFSRRRYALAASCLATALAVAGAFTSNGEYLTLSQCIHTSLGQYRHETRQKMRIENCCFASKTRRKKDVDKIQKHVLV